MASCPTEPFLVVIIFALSFLIVVFTLHIRRLERRLALLQPEVNPALTPANDDSRPDATSQSRTE